MRKASIPVLGLLIMFLFGCSSQIKPLSIEINKLNLLSAVGIDKGLKDPNNIRITVISKKKTDEKSGKSTTKKDSTASIYSNEAPTLLESQRVFQTFSDKLMYWGHIEYFLISEEAAKDGIAKYIDFFTRDFAFRESAKIYIIKGSTAEEFIRQSSTGDYFMPDRLKTIGDNCNFFSGCQDLTILEFMQWLNNKYSSAIAPVLYLKSKENLIADETKPMQEIRTYGYAIFKNLKLVTTIDEIKARGEDFLLNTIISRAIKVKDSSGNMVGLDLLESKTKITPVFNKGIIKEIKVKVKLSSNIDEVHSTSLKINRETVDYLSNEQSLVVKNEIESVIKTAQEYNCDFVDMANVFSTYHPILWRRHKDKWEEIFPNLLISVEVESKINRSYNIREPNGVFEEEHK